MSTSTLGAPIEAYFCEIEENFDTMPSSEAESQIPEMAEAEAAELCIRESIESDEIPEEAVTFSVSGSNSASQFAEAMTRVLQLTNYYRQRARLAPLQFNSRLSAAAQAHSNDMASRNSLSHTGSDGSSFSIRLSRYGYRFRWGGENIAQGQRSSDEVVNAWMNSSGHRANILNPNFREMGIGYNNRYWTQTFGG